MKSLLLAQSRLMQPHGVGVPCKVGFNPKRPNDGFFLDPPRFRLSTSALAVYLGRKLNMPCDWIVAIVDPYTIHLNPQSWEG